MVSKNYKPADLFEEHPVYHHWLALDMYKAYVSAQKQLRDGNTTITLTINAEEFSVERVALETANKFILNALSIFDQPLYQFGMRYSGEVTKTEICQTCTCAVAFNELIASPNGKILHQGPTQNRSGATPEIADYYGAVYKDGLIMSPFLVGDGKQPGEFKQALTQTAKYAHDLIENRKDATKPNPVLLGLPLVKDCLGLYVFVLGTEKLWGIPVVPKCSPSNPDVNAVYATLYAASQYMIKSHIVEVDMLKEPNLLGFEPLQVHDGCRVFKDATEKRVVKYFDKSMIYYKPNMELLDIVFRERGVHLEDLGDLKILTYDYFEQDDADKEPCFRQYSGIFKMLDAVHEAGYVHGDIRPQNLIFFADTSYLIDYDLAGPEGSRYPVGYKDSSFEGFNMRHPKAKPCCIMNKSHDRHALHKIMNERYSSSECAGILDKLLNPQVRLSNLAEELEKIRIDEKD